MATTYTRYPAAGGAGGIVSYVNFAAFPATAADGAQALALDTKTIYVYNLPSTSWKAVATPGDVLSLGSLDANAGTAQGASIANNALSLQSATATVPGLINTGTQTIAGAKTFTGTVTAPTFSGALSGNATSASTVTTNANLTGPITSTGNATAIASQTGTGSTFAMSASPTFTGTVTAPTFSGALTGHASLDVALTQVGAANGVASLDSSGLVPITQIPPAAIERMVIVADQTARFALTTATVQNGDTVKQTDTGVMYFVIDQNNLGNASGYSVYTAGSATTAASFTGSLIGDVTGTQGATVIGATTVTGKAITGFVSGAGTVSATDTILTALNKIVGNDALKAPIASPTFTGTVTAPTFSGALSGNATSATTAGNVSGTVAIGNGGTGQTTAPLAFGALSPLTTKGDLLTYGTANARLPVGSDNQVLIADAVQALGARWATLPKGAKNYINYGDFENNSTSGWSLKHTTLSSLTPNQTAGSWTSAAVSVAISTTTSGAQLAGTYSLQLATSGATTAGDMLVSDAFTIDKEDQAKILAFKFYYSPTVNPGNANWSGTSANSFQVWIYDVTNGAWIQPAGVYNLVQSSGVGIATGTFQTPSNGSQFQLALVSVNATTGAITVLMDDFSVGPQVTTSGAAMSDWALTSSTLPSAGFGTIANASFRYRREGDTMKFMGTFNAGTVAATGAYVSMPPGTAIDSSKMPTNVNGTVVGHGHAARTASTVGIAGSTEAFQALFYDGSDTSKVYITAQTGASFLVKNNVSDIYDSSNPITLEFTVPIQGWSSNTVQSSDFDGRLVAAAVRATGTYSCTTGTPIVFTSVDFDTTASYNTTTGAYVASSSGIYEVTASDFMYNATSSTNFKVYVNGAFRAGLCQTAATVNSGYGATVPLKLNAGDSITIVPDAGGSLFYSANDVVPMLGFKKLQGPAVVQATESVCAKYNTSTTSIASTTAAPMICTVKEFDSHGAYNTSTGIYTVPVAGKYRVGGSAISTTGTPGGTGVAYVMFAQKGGSNVSRISNHEIQVNIAQVMYLDGSVPIQCNAGDQIAVALSKDNAGLVTTALSGSAVDNWVSFERVGN